MLLDVVLSQPDADWHATEDDKVRLFTERFKVPRYVLPQRTFPAGRRGRPSTTRYFLDKLPICVAFEPPTVHFVYLALDQTAAGFARFLADHAELLARLPSWRIVLAAPRPFVSRSGYSAAFDRFRNGPWPMAAASPVDLGWYFRTAEVVARGDLAPLSVADIDRFRRLRERFAGPDYEALHGEWCARGDAALEAVASRNAPAHEFAGGLTVHQLSSRYLQFGSLQVWREPGQQRSGVLAPLMALALSPAPAPSARDSARRCSTASHSATRVFGCCVGARSPRRYSPRLGRRRGGGAKGERPPFSARARPSARRALAPRHVGVAPPLRMSCDEGLVADRGPRHLKERQQTMTSSSTASDQYLTIAEVAERLKLNHETARRLFLNEPSVVVICNPRKGKRLYRTLRIPVAVYDRVVTRLTRVA
jgi:hypothetical protein